MSVIESVKEGLKAAAIALSVVLLVAVAYFVAVRLPVTFDAINRAVTNVNEIVEKAGPVVDDCKKLTGDLTNTKDKNSLRGKIDGTVANVTEIVGDISAEIKNRGGLGAIIDIIRGALFN